MPDLMTQEQRELWNIGPDAYGLAFRADMHWRMTRQRASRIDGVIVELAASGPQSRDFSPELKALLKKEGGLVNVKESKPAEWKTGTAVRAERQAKREIQLRTSKCCVTRGPGGRSTISLSNGGFETAFADLNSAVEYFDKTFPLKDADNSRSVTP